MNQSRLLLLRMREEHFPDVPFLMTSFFLSVASPTTSILCVRARRIAIFFLFQI